MHHTRWLGAAAAVALALGGTPGSGAAVGANAPLGGDATAAMRGLGNAEWTTPESLRASARVGTIRGRVTDASSGDPLGTAQVSVVGTSFGALSDANGVYVIQGVPAGLYTVQVTRIGHATAQRENVLVTDGGTLTVDFQLRTTALALEGVVVTGLADPTSARRVPFTIARLSEESLQVPAANAIASIQGKVAGASVIAPAQPGGGINILLRTPTSINRSNTPLFVVDGVVLASTFARSTADLASLDIESIEVVKGAAAASLYGSRAANGVVQIRTRRGTGLGQDQTRITVRSEIGQDALARRIDLAKSHHYRVDASGQYVNAQGAVVPRQSRVVRPAAERFLDVSYRDPIFDHVEQFFEPGRFSTNSVTMARSSEATNFFTSLSQQTASGVVLDHGGFTRQDLRLNLDHRLGATVQFSFSGSHMRSNRKNLPGDTFFQLVQQAPDMDLLQPDPDGTRYIYQPDPEGVTPNPLYEIVTSTDEEDRVRTLASTELRWSPAGWIIVDGNLSYDRSDRTQTFFFPRGARTAVASWSSGITSRSSGTTTAVNASTSLQLRGQWNDFSGRVTIRALTEREDFESFTAQATGLVVGGVTDLDAGTVASVGGSTQEIASEGYFIIASGDYQGRFIFDGLARRDGSSLFGPEERWHNYYRGSAAWRLAEEAWWPFDGVNEFKLRYSIGTAGGRPNFADRFETYSFTAGGGLTKGTLGNRFLRPERAVEQEFGVDMILRDQVSVQLSHARNRTTDQLIAIPLPAGFGFTSQWQNAGTLEGTTWEITVEASLIDRQDLGLRVGFVADRSRHTITEFERACFRTGPSSAFYRCAGERIGTMYGTRFHRSVDELPEGLPRSQFQVNDDGLVVWVGEGGNWRNAAWGTSTSIAGRTFGWGLPILELDETGSSRITAIGNSNPDFNFGISSNLRWRNFTVYGLVDAQVGGDVYNRTNQRMYQYFRSGDTDQAGRPDELKKTTDYYTALYAANLINEWFVEDASFLKLRELSVRWRAPNLSNTVLGNLRVNDLTVFALGRNLLTRTNYKGYDPEAGTPLQRIDDFIYPQYRTVTAGVEVRF
jgi:TonB-linked SusC/RagA family outer membrane protein